MIEEQEKLLNKNIVNIVKNKDINQARLLLDEQPNADIAAIVNDLTTEEQITFLRLLKTSDAAEIFSYLDDEIQIKLAQSFTEEWGMKLLQELQSDELVDVLEELPANVTSKILAYTPHEKRATLNRLLHYDENQVGSIMSIDISSISNSYTCEQALHKIRRDYKKRNAELVHYYYVVNETQKLLGVLTLEEIIFANPQDKIDDIYSPVASIKASDKKEEAAQLFSEHDMSVLPVTNNEKRLIGMITSDEVIDVIQEETTEDLYKMAGINADKANEHEYIKTPWYKLVRFRLVWLVLLFLFATLTQIIIHASLSAVMTKVAETASLVIAFAAIIPVINNTTSNSGLQSNITVSRALSLNEIEKENYLKVIGKETLVGFALGLILAILNVARLGIYFSITKDLLGSNAMQYWAIIISTSVALLIALTLSKTFGALFPIIWATFKKDPLSISVLTINTIIDIISSSLLFGFTFLVIQII
ncbi:magnesium transporter [Mycoplasmopsis lipofaciens]|uniref:magnesium transporter n=1 Tax=Mycoplasmopsis lipofaciens TaxID=114884 RepID=UPI000489946C|nr:magnesium transporter [Mycoplasmopsis lipofaciens]